MSTEQTFWQAAWGWVKRVFRFVAAPIPALIILAVAVVLIVLGVKNIQVGGILDWVLGRDKKTGKKAVDVANTVPEDRVDDEGKIIPPGTPDEKGMTQAVVVPIENTGFLGNSTQVTVTPPGATEPVVVDLPEGVRAKDVDKVVIVTPDVYAVTVKDNSGIPAKKIDDLLSKYGG